MVVLGLAVIGSLAVAIGSPSNLLGSAPREQSWSALAGDVTVVDGETLRLGDRTLRLSGLKAPDRGEICRRADGRAFDCGAAAADALARLVAGQALSCQVRGRDAFGRGLARCDAGAADVNAALVAGGFALAYGSMRPDLRSQEQEARAASRGLWSAGLPDGWRARR